MPMDWAGGAVGYGLWGSSLGGIQWAGNITWFPALPNFFRELTALLMLLAPVAAGVCVFAAGMSFFRTGTIADSAMSGWIFWAILFLTVPSTMKLLFDLAGAPPFTSWQAPKSDTWTTPGLKQILHTLEGAVAFLFNYLAPALAAFLLVKAILAAAAGQSPLYPLLGCLFLLTLSGSHTYLETLATVHGNSQYALVDTLKHLWRYIANVVMPVAAALCIMGMIAAYILDRPVRHLAFTALACLTVSGLWNLIQQWAG